MDTSAPSLLCTNDWPTALAQAALDAAPILYLALDAKKHICYVNATARRLIGDERTIGRSVLDLLDAGSRAKAQRLIEHALAAAEGRAAELNQLTADGTLATINYYAVPLAAGVDDSAPRLLLIGQPTEQTAVATQRLIALNRRLNALYTISTAATSAPLSPDLLQQTLTVLLDELQLCAGAIVVAKPLAANLYEPPSGMFHVAAQQGFAPAFVERLNQPGAIAAFATSETERGEQSIRTNLQHDLGIAISDVPNASGPFLSVVATPLPGDNRLHGWLYTVADHYRAFDDDVLDLLREIGRILGRSIEHARLYQDLLHTSGQLAAVLDTIDSGVLLVDRAGIVRYANAQLGQLLESDTAGWLGRPRDEALPPSLIRHTTSRALIGGEIWAHHGATVRLLQRYVAPVNDPLGAQQGTIEVYTDVTAILEMNRLRDEFIAAAAHDLKTPVTAVKGYAQIAQRLAKRLGDQRLIDQLGMINARSDELARLMDGLLDMSRLQGARLRLDLQETTLQAIVARVAGYFEFDLRRRGRTLQVDLPAESIAVRWDRARIEAVLINLVDNALKYSPDGERVILAAQRAPGASDVVLLTITDHGIGVPLAERERIFERFYRARQAVERGFKGTGIGLYIARSIVELHGGRIWVGDALHGGAGATFHLRLPRIVEHADEPEEQAKV